MPGIYFNAKEDTVPFGDMLPLEEGELSTKQALGIAWDFGWTRGVTSSLARFTEQAGKQAGLDEVFADLTKPPKLEDKLDPKEANERYGVPGALSFSSPIRESVAQILRERKDEEIAQQFILDKAKGLQKLGVFGTELLSGVLDPAALAAGFIPIVPESMYLAWSTRSVVGARALTGAIEGSVGNALVEPIIFGQAAYEQAEYGALDSLINIAGGGVFGTGLHVVGGRLVDWMHGVQMKAHLKALQTAINQAGNGQKVQVEPIVQSSVVETEAIEVDFDGGVVSADSPTVADIDGVGKAITSTETYKFDLNDPNPPHHAAYFYDRKIAFNTKDGGEVIGVVADVSDTGFKFYGLADELDFNDIESYTFIKYDGPKPIEVGAEVKQPVQAAPLVGDVTDGVELFAATHHIEALNAENLISENVGQLGSNTGDVFTDKATGKKYYVKRPPPEKLEQSRQEFISYTFYKMAGQDVPDVRPVLEDGNFVGVASEWIDNAVTPKSQADLYSRLAAYKNADPDGFERFMRGVIIDMWLANWDWAAAGNIVFRDGTPIRIDYGGTLQYRAMGSKKAPEDFSEVVTEFHSFFDPASSTKAKIHNQAAWEVLQLDNLENFKKGVNDLATISDEDITGTLYKTGLSADDAADISAALIARRMAILEKYADAVDPTLLKSAEFFTYEQAKMFVEKMAPEWKPLSQAASSELSNYKGSGYLSLNKYLRGLKKNLTDEVIKIMESMKKAMDKAVQGFSFPQEVYLWRGGIPKSALAKFGVTASDDVAAIRKKLLGNGIGQVISDKAFVSTSTNKSFALSWGDSSGSGFALRIKVPKGQNAAVPAGNSMYMHGFVQDGEMEFVLPRDTVMAITDVFKDKGTDAIVVNVKVVPKGVKPIKPELAMKMAEKHIDEFSSAVDESLIDAELTYSLKEAMKVPEGEELMTAINKEISELMQNMKASTPEAQREALDKIVEQIDSTHGTMVEQSNAMAKGAMAAYGCVLKNANL